MKNPCYGCTTDTGRSPTCHATCQSYKEWNEEHKSYLNDYRMKKDLDCAYMDFKEKSIKRSGGNKRKCWSSK